MAKDTPKFKFPMHNVHYHKMMHNLKVACILSIIAPLCYYLMHNVPKQIKYRNFYTHYDPMDAFDRMQRGGYLSSCPPVSDSDEKPKKKK